MSSQKFIGLIKSKAEHCLRYPMLQDIYLAFHTKGRRGKGKGKLGKPLASLLQCITQKVTWKVQEMKISASDAKAIEKPFCKCCKNRGHATNDYWTWGKEQCTYCNKYNHTSADCYFKDKLKLDKKRKGNENSCKCIWKEEVNTINAAIIDSD